MSATNRGSVRTERDAYFTADGLAASLVGLLPIAAGERVLEPHGGGGAFVRALVRRTPLVDACEIDPALHDGLVRAGARAVHGDFLGHAGAYDWVIGNPPYLDAEAHVRQALAVGRNVVFLLRLAFLESRERYPFWRDHPAHRVWVLAKRPAFGGFASTERDKTAYAWFWWKREPEGEAQVAVHEPVERTVERASGRANPLHRWSLLGSDARALVDHLAIARGQRVAVVGGVKDTLFDVLAAHHPIAFEERADDQLPFGDFDRVVGAPPLDQLEAVVPAALERLRATGAVHLLLPLHALESRGRVGFWRAHPPERVEVLATRPRLATGVCGAHALAWFTWRRSPSPAGQTCLTVCDPPQMRARPYRVRRVATREAVSE